MNKKIAAHAIHDMTDEGHGDAYVNRYWQPSPCDNQRSPRPPPHPGTRRPACRAAPSTVGITGKAGLCAGAGVMVEVMVTGG